MIPGELSALLGITFPLVQAGMGGIASPVLASAVSNQGCAGVVALYNYSPEEIKQVLRSTRNLTPRPFGVSLVPEIVGKQALLDQIAAALRDSDSNVFFTFLGLPTEEGSRLVHEARRPLLIQVGSRNEAVEAAQIGADGLILQGQEAGGHLLGKTTRQALLEEVAGLKLGVPLVAAGGIANGGDFAEAIHGKASGVLCGTFFVATTESMAHRLYKERVVQARAENTVITDVFKIGWPDRLHRVLRSEVVEKAQMLPPAMIATTTVGSKTYLIPRFSAAAPTLQSQGAVEQMAMYCGTSCERIHAIRSVRSVIAEFLHEAQKNCSA